MIVRVPVTRNRETLMTNSSAKYIADEVAKIQHAYQAIFPVITPALADYWGLHRQRPWSYVTSNFHASSYEQLYALDQAVREIDNQTLDIASKGQALRAASQMHGVGYSIGLCPWTDHLLAETYSEQQDCATILLGHDWYPIVVHDPRPSGSPLGSHDALRYVERYWPAAPQAVFDGETVGFFFNLYPDYRPPGDPKCGNLKKYGYSYAQCLIGLDAMIAAMASRFRHIQLISWGANVWDVLQTRVHELSNVMGLSDFIQTAPGKILSIDLGGRTLSYLPIFHPAFWGNFGRPFHLRHVKAGFANLGLGMPGPRDAQSLQVYRARQI
ncbi:hypothetical protein P5W98_00085 [Paraburkholderia sp. A1BS-2L]|uniref:hypothetical protein n=1 Tax=Paraburkholderia sp. A1BS-2L TaxID=3028373 RepID=UPI003DA7B494